MFATIEMLMASRPRGSRLYFGSVIAQEKLHLAQRIVQIIPAVWLEQFEFPFLSQSADEMPQGKADLDPSFSSLAHRAP